MWRYNYIVNVSGNIVDAVEELGIDQQELQNKLNFTSPRKQQYTVMKSNGKDISYTDLFHVTFHGILSASRETTLIGAVKSYWENETSKIIFLRFLFITRNYVDIIFLQNIISKQISFIKQFFEQQIQDNISA